MDPSLIAFAVKGAIRLGRAGVIAYEQYSRDKEVLFPDSLVTAMSDRTALVDALTVGHPEVLNKIKAHPQLAPLWRDNPQGPVDDEAEKVLRAVLIKEGVQANALAVHKPGVADAEAVAARMMIEQWADGKGPDSPLIPVALTIVDIGLEFVAANPAMTGANGRAAKIVGALADNLALLIPEDASQLSVKAIYGERLIAAFLRAGLDAVSENADALIEEDHIRDLAVNALGPVIESLPDSAEDLDEPMNWLEVSEVLTGAAAQAAIRTVATQPAAFFGTRFKTDAALGALTKAMLEEAAQRRLAENFSEAGFIAIFQSAARLAASRPELILGRPDGAVEDFKVDVFAKVMGVLAEAEPPFDGELGARIAAASLDVLQDHAVLLLDVDDDWDEVAAAATAMVIAGIQDGIVNKDPKFLEKVFTTEKFTELARVFLVQVAATPGMIVGTHAGPGGEKAFSVELKRIVSAVAAAMAADEHLLLTADDWIVIAGVAVEEAAANPGALVGLDPEDTGEAVLTGLLATVLTVASQTITTITEGGRKRVVRAAGDALFGETLKDALVLTIRAATSNIKAVADPASEEALKQLVQWLTEETKRRAGGGAMAEGERLGSKDWLLLYRHFLPQVFSDKAFAVPTPAEVERILRGAG
jgi:hypothetical protein